jgi:hypothetical protein
MFYTEEGKITEKCHISDSIVSPDNSPNEMHINPRRRSILQIFWKDFLRIKELNASEVR